MSDHNLLRAAFSHLNLALLNVCEQAQHFELSAQETHGISKAVITLQQLASQEIDKSGLSVLRKDMEHMVSTVDSITGQESNQRKHDADIVGGAPKSDTSIKVRDCKDTQDAELSKKEDDPHGLVQFSEVAQLPDSATSEPTAGATAKSVHLDRSDVIKLLIDAFYELDTDGHLAVQDTKLQTLSTKLGLRKRHVRTIFSQVDRTHDRLIYLDEWTKIAEKIVRLHRQDDIIPVIRRARGRRLHGQNISSGSSRTSLQSLVNYRRCRFIISYRSAYRMVWDILIFTHLMVVAFTLPMSLAFDDLRFISNVELVVDCVFIMDLLLNFRTTYLNEQREEIWDSKIIAMRYLKTWFLLDLVSSVPFEKLSSGVLPRMHAAKLLKAGKLFKAVKLLRIGKLARLCKGSEVIDSFEEFMWAYNLLSFARTGTLVVRLIYLAHWLACILISLDGDCFYQYFGNASSDYEKYQIALYWAIQTSTTVGYGDVPMSTDDERVYAMVAMIAGGAFYGYIIGVMSSLLLASDMDRRAIAERMEVVVSWLNNHYELPPLLRRRVWKHFKEFLAAKKAVQDSLILNDLPPQLRNEVVELILPDTVRNNPLLHNVSLRALTKIMSMMAEVKIQANEYVIHRGDSSRSMFIIQSGLLLWDKDGKDAGLCAGDYFGEETVISDTIEYQYSVSAHSKAHMFRIRHEEFIQCFEHTDGMQDDLITMLRNFYSDSPQDKPLVMQASPGSSSLIAGGPQGISSSFVDEISSNVIAMRAKVDVLHSWGQKDHRVKDPHPIDFSDLRFQAGQKDPNKPIGQIKQGQGMHPAAASAKVTTL